MQIGGRTQVSDAVQPLRRLKVSNTAMGVDGRGSSLMNLYRIRTN